MRACIFCTCKISQLPSLIPKNLAAPPALSLKGPAAFISLCPGSVLCTQGLPVISAPEEAEALMAALEMAGLVDACATGDGDALVFGAMQVYHTLKLQVSCGKAVPSFCLCCTLTQCWSLNSCCSARCRPPCSALPALPCRACPCS